MEKRTRNPKVCSFRRGLSKYIADFVLVYEEQVDGFTFSRSTRARKGKATESIAPPTAAAQPKSTRKTKAASPTSADDSVASQRRRSKRLSGDKEPEKRQEAETIRTKKSTRDDKSKTVQQIRDHSPQAAPNKLVVGKKRDVTTIALPFADTPVIKRNKEMRAAQSRTSTHRRSSAGLRGRRASSLIESGTSNGRRSYNYGETKLTYLLFSCTTC
jgi:kinetochore protein Mis13/DSN1